MHKKEKLYVHRKENWGEYGCNALTVRKVKQTGSEKKHISESIN